MNIQPDIAVHDSRGNLALVIEIKNKRGTDSEWAAKMRRNMMVHGLLPDAPFFLLALPDRFYLWTIGQLPELERQPDYEIDTASLFKSYAEKMGTDLQSLGGAGFELMLQSWLWELIRGTELADVFEAGGADDWLTETGLLAAIKHGNLVSETVP